jgi:hypothetical protein
MFNELSDPLTLQGKKWQAAIAYPITLYFPYYAFVIIEMPITKVPKRHLHPLSI